MLLVFMQLTAHAVAKVKHCLHYVVPCNVAATILSGLEIGSNIKILSKGYLNLKTRSGYYQLSYTYLDMTIHQFKSLHFSTIYTGR